MELHLVKSVVEIERIKLSIRFPGQLTFQFKNNHLYEDIPKLYPLVNGESLIEESVVLHLESPYTLATETYAEVLVDLIISINTATGKIVAGVVTFNAIQNTTVALPFKRCSDKTATAMLNIGFAKVEKIRDIEDEVSRIVVNSPARNMRSAERQTGLSQLRVPPVLGGDREEEGRKERGYSNESSQNSRIRGLMTSKVKAVGSANVDSRLKEMEENNEKKIRLIKKEKEEIEGELDRTREKWKLAERKEKELYTSNRDLKDNLEKRRMRILDLQSKISELERVQSDYERKVKVSHAELKTASENYESLAVKYAILEKKFENKEQSTIERERRLTEKIQQIEQDHNKSVHEYNVLLEKMELQEKASQSTNKLKEKGYMEEKAKWKELYDRLEKESLKRKEENEELLARTGILATSEKSLILKTNELETQLDILKNSFESQRVQYEKEQTLRKELQREMGELKGVQQDKNALKKKINQGSQDYQRLKDRLDKLTLEYNQLKQTSKQMEQHWQQSKKEKKILIAKCSEYQKCNSHQEKEIAKLQSDNNSLSSKNTFLNERLNDLKTKSDQQNTEYNEKETAMMNKINSLYQSKEYLENDLEDLRWSLEKERESMHENERKLKERGEEILRQQEENLKLQKNVEHSLSKYEEACQEVSDLKAEIEELKRREIEHLESIKEKERKIYETSKKLTETEQESFLSLAKFKNTVSENANLINQHEATIQSLKNELQQKTTQISDIQSDYEKLNEENREHIREIKMLRISLDESEKTSKQEQQSNSELKRSNDSLRRQLEESRGKLTEGEESHLAKINELHTKIEQLQKQNKGYTQDLETFKKAMQQFMIFISKEDETTNNEIIAVPDQAMAKAQLEALATRNKYIGNYKNKVLELEAEISYLEKEVESKSKGLQAKSEELEALVKSNSQKMIQSELKWQQEKDKLKEQQQELNKLLQNSKSDREKLQNKHKGLRELFEQQKASLAEMQSKYEKATKQIQNLQESILTIRSREISKKGEDEIFVHTIKIELTAEIEKYKEKISELIKEGQGSEKILGDREKQISGFKAAVASLEQERNKLQSELLTFNEKYAKQSEEKTQLEQTATNNQMLIAELKHSLEGAKIEVTSQRELKRQIENKLKEAHEQLSDLLIGKENLQHKLENLTKASSLSSEEQKNKIVQLEESLQTETKKSAKLFEQLTEKEGEYQLKEFLAKQLQEKLDEKEALNNDLRKENEDKRGQITRLSEKVEELNRSILGLEKDITDHLNEKNSIHDELTQKKLRIEELLVEVQELQEKMEKLKHQLEDSEKREEDLRQEKLGLIANVNELRESLTETKKEVQRSNARESEAKSKLATVLQQLKEKEEFYQSYKSKNWDENQRESNNLRQKCKQLQKQLHDLEQQRESERYELKSEFESIIQEKDELELLLEQKDDVIEKQEMEIIESQNRIINLNGELRNCLEAWEKEKAAAIPSRKQASKIEEDMNKFQSYAAELDKKTKEILNLSTYKIKDEIMAKTAQSLVELLELIHRSKLRALSKASDVEKPDIVKEYDRMREKIEQVLKNQKINTAK